MPDSKKKKRFSDHLMPHRMLRQAFWLLLESASVFVVVLFTDMLWRSLMIRFSSFPVVLIGGILFGFVFAYADSVRLSRDQTVRKAFLDATADGSYQQKNDKIRVRQSDEYRNDLAVFVLLHLILLLFLLARLLLGCLYSAEYRTLEESMQAFYQPAMLLSWLSVLTALSYSIFHLYLSVHVHKVWNADRLHRTDPDAELPLMKPFI